LYPGDMYCFTRKPVFLIVDSDNSTAFKTVARAASLFTLFLHCPLSGMAHPAYQCFFRDDFLRALLLRFLFCCLALRLHRDFSRRAAIDCSPALPDDLLDVDSVQAKVLDLAELFDARDLFCEAADYSRDL
uniref:Protein SCAI n=1 Tax=Macrostomum lignano TaxID=282301 RepID=A0A1I8FHR7_9PLAT